MVGEADSTANSASKGKGMSRTGASMRPLHPNAPKVLHPDHRGCRSHPLIHCRCQPGVHAAQADPRQPYARCIHIRPAGHGGSGARAMGRAWSAQRGEPTPPMTLRSPPSRCAP